MSDATKLAMAIGLMTIAFIFFFFAFHPNGVENVNNPGDMLKHLIDEFNNVGGTVPTTPSGSGATTEPVLPTPTGNASTSQQIAGE